MTFLLNFLNRIPFLGYVAIVGWITAAGIGWLYKEQVEYTGRVISGCEADMYKAALGTAVEQMQRQAEVHQEWRIRMQEQIAAESVARERAEIIAGEAIDRLKKSQQALAEADNACLDDIVEFSVISSLQ